MEISEEKYWKALNSLLGTWKGEISGKAGNGEGTRIYQRILKSKYIKETNHVVFPPQEKNPDGEIHEDMGIYSYDKNSKKGKLRVFYGEGYVSKYELVELALNTIIFQSINNENLPGKFLAKLTVDTSNKSTLHEKFELAPKGKEFTMCIETTYQLSS